MSKALLRFALLTLPLVLTACGEGWEAQRTDQYAPYGNSRTAGTGVVYVRAKMLPKKDLVAEPVMEEIKAEPAKEEVEAVEPEPVLEAEEIFSEAQHKGGAVKKEKVKVKAVEPAPEKKAAVKEEKHSSEGGAVLTPMPTAGEKDEVLEEENHSSLSSESVGIKMTAEDYISQEPKTFVSPKVDVIRMDSYELDDGENVRTIKTAGVDSSDIDGDIEIYETEVVVQPKKYIVVPKKDVTAYLSVGEEELGEIYNQPF